MQALVTGLQTKAAIITWQAGRLDTARTPATAFPRTADSFAHSTTCSPSNGTSLDTECQGCLERHMWSFTGQIILLSSQAPQAQGLQFKSRCHTCPGRSQHPP